MPMRILFIHNNFPGQYKRIVKRLDGDKNYDLRAATLNSNKQDIKLPHVRYKFHRDVSKDMHPALKSTEKAVLNGQALVKAVWPGRLTWKPDIVLSHSGWGPSMFIKDIWPDTKHLSYFEWYYQSEAGDVGFLDNQQNRERDINERIRIRLKATAMLHDFAQMDWAQCPTEYQASQFPDIFRSRMTILHDGVDTEFFAPDETKTVTLGGKEFRRGDPLISYIARGMEPYRGFPQFIEAIAILQRKNPDVQAIVIGEDRVAYGSKRADGQTWKEWAVKEFKPDLSRLHFVGPQPLEVLRDVLQVSAAHIYLTVPFVLSWSMVEAMSAGALLVGSDTDPVREVVQDGVNGLLVPFDRPNVLADLLSKIVRAPRAHDALRAAARQTVLDRYEFNEMTGRYLKLINQVAAGDLPPRL